MRISDWSSDVCSSDLFVAGPSLNVYNHRALAMLAEDGLHRWVPGVEQGRVLIGELKDAFVAGGGTMPELEVTAWGRLTLSYSARCFTARALDVPKDACRSEEHTSELQSLMRNPYAVFCLK